MSARQAFIPRPPSRLPSSEPHPHPTDARMRDADKETQNMLVNENGKARSITAFLGQKRGATDTAGPTQGIGLGRSDTSKHRRSFEGIRRPEMTPMSIIPYPATTQLGAGMKQPGVQTPRKTAGLGPFEFPRPMTPVSVPKGPKKGFVVGDLGDEAASNEDMHGSGAVFMGPEGETNVHTSAGSGMGGYMRAFEGSRNVGNGGGLQVGLERDVAAPVPAYAFGGLDSNLENEGVEIGDTFVRSSQSTGAIAEGDRSLANSEDQRSFGATKRRMMHHEDIEENGRYTDAGHKNQTRGPAKRMKQVQHDPNEYFPISSPHMPPTPGPPTSSGDTLDSSALVGSLFENIEEFVSLVQVEADWKRWRECTTDEWIKGADALAQEYTDIINMVKDHLTQKVVAYGRMVSSVEGKQAEVKRNIEMILGKGNIVRENISKLGTRK